MNLKLGSPMIRLTLLVICFSLIKNAEPVVPLLAAGKAVAATVHVINDISTLILGVKGLIDLGSPSEDTVGPKLDQIYEQCQKIDTVTTLVQNLSSNFKVDIQRVIIETGLSEDMSYLEYIYNEMNVIATQYQNDFLNIFPYIKNYQSESMDTYVKSIIDNNVLTTKLTHILQATRLPNVNNHYAVKNIFQIAIAHSTNEKNYHRDCDNISAQDKLYNFYNYVLGAVAEGYTMIIMAFQYRKLTSNDPRFYTDRQNQYLNIFKRSIAEITRSAQYHLNLIDNINYKSSMSCDPSDWKEGVNYIRIKNYVSMITMAYMEYHDVSVHADARSAEYDCTGFHEYNMVGKRNNIATQHCTETFVPKEAQWCFVKSYGEFENYRSRIMTKSCQSSERPRYLQESCSCDRYSDPILSVRKVSLQMQSCNTNINEVVTAVRFFEKEGIFRIEVQCGVFSNGRVNPNTLRWNTDERSWGRENHLNWRPLTQNLKSFNLDDILLPDGEFVTGVQFEIDQSDWRRHSLSLVVQGTRMYNPNNNHEDIIGVTQLHLPTNRGQARMNIDIKDLVALRGPKTMQTYEMSQSGINYIDLTTAKWSNEYGNNAIVPFLEMNPYIPLVPVPLGGLGLIYKSCPGYAGFLGFKYISPKFMHFVDPNFAQKLNIQPQIG